MTARTCTWLGAALAVLSLGLPWRAVTGTPTYVTSGYYSNDCYYDYFDTYVCDTSFTPGVIVPGLPGGSYPGTDSVVRFFIVAALVLALVGGLHLARPRALRWAAYVAAAGVLLYVVYGLMAGSLALGAAALCFGLAARNATRAEPAGGRPG
jgi:hypothetical protein